LVQWSSIHDHRCCHELTVSDFKLNNMCDIIFSFGLFFFSYSGQSNFSECYLSLHPSGMGANLSHRLRSGLLPIYCRKEFQLRFLNFELRFCLLVCFFQTFGTAYPYNRFYVCNYGPTGNWISLPVYLQGTAGSACPAGTVNNNGLCAWTQLVWLCPKICNC
jgi:hypothetical protein